jgi:predicted RND superfamily exporter protein
MHVQEEKYKGVVVASADWVTATTHTKISQSIYATVLLSVVLSAIVVFVFCGRPLLTLIATVTVIMTNLSVMGIMYVWGWKLGAIEGMSITSLVGLSVDFCIHLCEGYVHGKAQDRHGKARFASIEFDCPRNSKSLMHVLSNFALLSNFL